MNTARRTTARVRTRRRMPLLFRRRGRGNRRRNLRGTIVRVHNRRPIPLQVEPKPLNFGAGGLSTTIRITRQIKFDKADLTKVNCFGTQDEISFTEILAAMPGPATYYEQLRIHSAKATLMCTAGTSSKSLVAMALVPIDYNDWAPSATVDSLYKILDQGVFVLKPVWKPNVSAWLPARVQDNEYYDIDASGQSNNTLFKLQIAGICDPSDFLRNSSTATEGYIGVVVIDVNMDLRGKNSKSTSYQSRLEALEAINSKSKDLVMTPIPTAENDSSNKSESNEL